MTTSRQDVDASQAVSSTVQTDDPYANPFPDHELPCSAYIYYLRPKQDDGFEVRAYYFERLSRGPISRDRLIKAAKMVAETALLGVPPPCGTCFNAFPWRKISYLAVLIDDPDWEFDEKAIEFKPGGDYKKNRTFYNARHFPITIRPENQPPRNASLFYCTNYMRPNPDGVACPEKFKFIIKPNNLGRFASVEADGTNLGPPVPPPYARRKVGWLEGLLAALARLFGLR